LPIHNAAFSRTYARPSIGHSVAVLFFCSTRTARKLNVRNESRKYFQKQTELEVLAKIRYIPRRLPLSRTIRACTIREFQKRAIEIQFAKNEFLSKWRDQTSFVQKMTGPEIRRGRELYGYTIHIQFTRGSLSNIIISRFYGHVKRKRVS